MPRVIQSMVSLLLLVLATASVAHAEVSVEQMLADRTIGDPKAPVSIVEYSSLTCPHCAEFHKTVLPQVKDGLVATGKARFTFRDFPLDGRAALATMVSRCVPEDRYYGFLDVLFSTQEQWAKSPDPKAALRGLAKLAGVSEAQADACMNNRALLEALKAQNEAAAKEYGIQGTPTVLVDGKTVPGAYEYSALAAAVEKAAAANAKN